MNKTNHHCYIMSLEPNSSILGRLDMKQFDWTKGRWLSNFVIVKNKNVYIKKESHQLWELEKKDTHWLWVTISPYSPDYNWNQAKIYLKRIGRFNTQLLHPPKNQELQTGFWQTMAEAPQIAICGAGTFVKTQYIPRLAEISNLVNLKAIWSRSEVPLK